MIQLVIGIVIVALGLPFFIRGWIFSVAPEHAITLRAKERNMRMGLETNMKMWGRKVRRMGTLLMLAGGILTVWGAGVFR